MLTLKKIALTGNLASGKSTVCRFFKELGAWVISADTIVHQYLSPKTDLGKKVIEVFGEEIVNNQQIDRKKIAEKVFNNPHLLKTLENLVHPLVKTEIDNEFQKAVQANAPLFVAEIPLYFEVTSFQKNFDQSLLVTADKEIRRKRYNDDSEFDKRNARQLPDSQKKADWVIFNNGSLNELKKQVSQVYQQIT